MPRPSDRLSIPTDLTAACAVQKAASLARKRDGSGASPAPASIPRRFAGNAVTDDRPGLAAIVREYLDEWRSGKAGAAIAGHADEGEDDA
jgi:hypothetical protein